MIYLEPNLGLPDRSTLTGALPKEFPWGGAIHSSETSAPLTLKVSTGHEEFSAVFDQNRTGYVTITKNPKLQCLRPINLWLHPHSVSLLISVIRDPSCWDPPWHLLPQPLKQPNCALALKGSRKEWRVTSVPVSSAKVSDMVIPNFKGGREVQSYYALGKRWMPDHLWMSQMTFAILLVFFFSFLLPHFLWKHTIKWKNPARVRSRAEW